nr:HAD family hydrolase [Saccharopolyspora gloriosae]
MRGFLDGELPGSVAQSRDPFDVLKHAAEQDDQPALVEGKLRELEVRAIASAPATPGVEALLRTLREREQRVFIVSNNSQAAVLAYLDMYEMRPLVEGISAREGADPALLKPHPFLLNQALTAMEARLGDTVMIGDSLTDVFAAQAVGIPVIAYANKRGKRELLEAHQPTAVIEHMSELRS